MYTRPDWRRVPRKDVILPENYSGNAFIEEDERTEEEAELTEIENTATPDNEDTEAVTASAGPIKKGLFSGGIESDDLIILGVILLLSQDGLADDILPILLMILFFKK